MSDQPLKQYLITVRKGGTKIGQVLSWGRNALEAINKIAEPHQNYEYCAVLS